LEPWHGPCVFESAMHVIGSHFYPRPEDDEDYGRLVRSAPHDRELPLHPWLWVGVALVLLAAGMMMLMVLALGAGTAKRSQPGDPGKTLPGGHVEAPAALPAGSASAQ
jgi:hypothetical protein